MREIHLVRSSPMPNRQCEELLNLKALRLETPLRVIHGFVEALYFSIRDGSRLTSIQSKNKALGELFCLERWLHA